MREINFRTLRADEIDVRPVSIKDNKATMLLYIDSRAVVRLLNETVGASDWEMVFESVNGQVVGKLGIWDDDKGRFIYKSDTGSESNIEAAKGLFSDCYKRCLSRWGVDELYTAPRIVVDDDGYGCGGYKVAYIDYNENREIIRLQIANRFGKVVYDYVEDNHLSTPIKPVEQPSQPRKVSTPTDNANPVLNGLISFCSSLKPTADKGELKRFYEFYSRKCNGWRGEMDYNNLWQRWCATAR